MFREGFTMKKSQLFNTELALFNAQQIEQGSEPVASVKDIAIAAHSDEQAASVAVEDVRLACEYIRPKEFVKIYYNGDTTYGGTQNWYVGARTINGCGAVSSMGEWRGVNLDSYGRYSSAIAIPGGYTFFE